MASSTPVKEIVFIACATVGFSWKAPRNDNFSTTIGQRIFAYGEKISPANEKQNTLSFLLRRPISNQLIHVAHLTEVASLATEAVGQEIKGVWNRFFGTPDIHPETKKKLAGMQQNLHEKLALINDCKEVVLQFGQVVEEFQEVNSERSQVRNTISSESIPVFSIEIPQNLLPSLQVLTKELGNLAGDQPETLKVYIELAVQIEEEKLCTQEESERLQQLQQILPAVVEQGIESKKNLEQGVKTLTPLVEKATPERRSKIPSQIKSGTNSLGSVQRALFIFSTTEV